MQSEGQPLVDEPASLIDDNKECTDITPLRAHYLKKCLIQLQFGKELDALASTDIPGLSNLSLLGPPFSPISKDVAKSLPADLDLPFCRFIFRQFVLTFPFMAGAPKNFYAEKVQPFVDAMVARNITSSSSLLDKDGSQERAVRKKLVAKIERNMGLFLGSATKLVEQEEVVRLTQQDLDRLERLAQKRLKRQKKNRDYFEVNVVGVRTVVDKGRMRSRAHEEFIIRTRRSGYHDVYVSRRYGDFRTLADEACPFVSLLETGTIGLTSIQLSKRYPDENIRPPPAKDRAYVSAPPTATLPSFSEQLYDAAAGGLSSAASYLSSMDMQGSGASTPSHEPAPPPSHTPPPHPSKLAREKNRLTLRSYIHSLMRSYTIASSPVLKSFLLSGFIQLSPEELEDARKREEADKVREDGRKRFAKEMSSRVDGLRDAVRDVKGDVMGKDGLTHVFGTIKITQNINDLPANYQSVVEWARISLASTVFHTFVASDDSSETLASLKRIHGLMPYLLLKGALKITNPIGMIRAVLDLFLAQPFGGRSLLQRMFAGGLTEEVRGLEEEIEAVKERVGDEVVCEKVRLFVEAPREIQALYKADAVEEDVDVVVVVLRGAEEPHLNRAQMSRLAKGWRSYDKWKQEIKERRVREGKDLTEHGDSDDDEEGPPDEDAWFIEDLRVLTALYQRLREKEQLIALIFEGFTAELLKDIITIFYTPLAQVYRAASIADSLSDFQNFINDLIRTVEGIEELSQTDPARTVQAFINLIQRHEQSFYSFVHKVHSKGEGLFDSLMRWIELFLTLIREGLGPEGSKVSLEFLLPHTGTDERKAILEEVDQVALYHYKLKVVYEDKLRRRFGRAQGIARGNGSSFAGEGGEADAEDAAAQALMNDVLGEFNFGELVKGAADDVAAQETDSSEDDSSDDDDSEEGSSEYETGSESDQESTSSSVQRVKNKEKALPSTPSVSGHSNVPGFKPPGSEPALARQTDIQRTQQQSRHHHTQSQQVTQRTKDTQSTRPDIPRKRSLSLKSMKSMSSLLRGIGDRDKDRNKSSGDQHAVPPLPPLPPSAGMQSEGYAVYRRGSVNPTSAANSAGHSREGSSRSSPTTSTLPSPRSSTSSYATVGSGQSLGGQNAQGTGGAPLPPLPASNNILRNDGPSSSVRHNIHVVTTSASGSPINSTPSSPVTLSAKVTTPSPLAGVPFTSPLAEMPPPISQVSSSQSSGAETIRGSEPTSMAGRQAALSVVMDVVEEDATPLTPPKTDSDSKGKGKKSQTIQPPDLKHIPQLVPVFVEMLRPLLVPRKRTLAS